LKQTPELPPSVATATHAHRVAFYETDAMGIVHHSNYLRFFEHARVDWLAEHDQPYTAYVDLGLHFATTLAEVDYKRTLVFDDTALVTTWMEWVRAASLCMSYRITVGDELKATGRTEHAAVSTEGKVRRLPKDRRLHLQTLSLRHATSETHS
jgi:acyl-CoA thioester hydrolase